MGKLDGKVAIVTGASRGIGKGVAQHFAAEGAKVVCAARTLKEGTHPLLEGSLETTVAEIKKSGGVALAVPTNVADEASCNQLVETTKKEFGPADIIVNDAVIGYFFPVKDMTIKQWITGFNVNVHGPFMLIKKVLPDMIERKSGAIINISSESAVGPGRGPYNKLVATGSAAADMGGSLYGATKAAIERLTQGLAREVYQYGITVACVSPSIGVETPGATYALRLATEPQRAERKRDSMWNMTMAILLLATDPLDKVTGRVTYCQLLLKEYGLIDKAEGWGADKLGTGYSRI